MLDVCMFQVAQCSHVIVMYICDSNTFVVKKKYRIVKTLAVKKFGGLVPKIVLAEKTLAD